MHCISAAEKLALVADVFTIFGVLATFVAAIGALVVWKRQVRAQAEHSADAQAILVTTSRALANATLVEVEAQMKRLGRESTLRESIAHARIILVDSLMCEEKRAWSSMKANTSCGEASMKAVLSRWRGVMNSLIDA